MIGVVLITTDEQCYAEAPSKGQISLLVNFNIALHCIALQGLGIGSMLDLLPTLKMWFAKSNY